MKNRINLFSKVIDEIYLNPIYYTFFHTLTYQLKKELKNCSSVLDLGCGPSSPLRFCSGIKYSVGVEPFSPYLEESKRSKIHTRYLNAKIEELYFPDNSFDAVILVEVLEHMSQSTGEIVIKKMERWAKKKVIITSPNGFLTQKAVHNNKLQEHLSGWEAGRMQNMGYKLFGLGGLKILRHDPPHNELGNVLATIRFRPRIFWFIVVNLTQLFSHYFPKLAFSWFGIKKL